MSDGGSVAKTFVVAFGLVEGLFIVLALPYMGEKPFFGFGSFGGFVLVSFFSMFIAFIVAAMHGGAKRGQQIGNIIDEKDPKGTNSSANTSKKEDKDATEKAIGNLKERFADGEISAEEFKEKKKVLQED